LDHGRAGQLGIEGEEFDDRLQAFLHPLQPRLAAVAVGDHLGEDLLDQHLVGGEEALVLVLEVFVEGGAGDARLLDHVGNRSLLVALATDDADHCRQDEVTPRFGCHQPVPGSLKTLEYLHHSGSVYLSVYLLFSPTSLAAASGPIYGTSVANRTSESNFGKSSARSSVNSSAINPVT